MLNEKPIIQSNLDQKELIKHFPRYAFNPTPLPYGGLKRAWIGTVINLMKLVTWIILNPRKTPVGNLDKEEVSGVYRREWETYNRKHHLTTRGMDLLWRRWAGWAIASMRRNFFGKIKILDLCTGTGLAIDGIISILKEWGIKAEIVGLDYCEQMLSVARSFVKPDDGNFSVQFMHGDATDLKFKANSLDFIMQIFGIGGIDKLLKEFYGVLKILKPGGRFIMADIHQPIPELPGEWPFFFKWLKMPIFEAAVKNKPDLIFLDLVLPWENGFNVLEKLKKEEETKEIPVVILSNLSGSEDHKKCFDLGAEDFLVKTRMSIKEVIDVTKKILK